MNKTRKVSRPPGSGLLAVLTLVLALLAPSAVSAANYTVTNTASSGAGSLALAVQQANYTTPNTLDYIRFNIPGAGPHIITITTTLYLNDQVVIDGMSQPGYAGDPLIHVHGNGGVFSIFLLQNDPGAGNPTNNVSTIQGLEMYNFLANAVTIFNSSQGNFIQYNWLGFHKSGAIVSKNTSLGSGYASSRGVGIQSSWNTIRFNTISGVDNGITVGDDFSSPSTTKYVTNAFMYNKIGTDPTGMTAVGYGNTSDGIFLGKNAQEMWIGPENTLSGMASAGVELLHADNWHNIIFQNFIGTNANGTAVIGNGELGVLISNGANQNAVGGPWGGNLISGNTLAGVSLGTDTFGGAHTNWVQYNTIGLNASATAALGSQQMGVAVSSGSTYNTVEGNTIAGNTFNGAVVINADQNSVSRNYIGRNISGTLLPNGAYGIVLNTGADYNWVLENIFGSNVSGSCWVSPSAIGTVGLPCP